MPHPTEIKRLNGKIFHKEDDNLTIGEARALKKHLRKTEDKLARIFTDAKHTGKHEVWWAKQS